MKAQKCIFTSLCLRTCLQYMCVHVSSCYFSLDHRTVVRHFARAFQKNLHQAQGPLCGLAGSTDRQAQHHASTQIGQPSLHWIFRGQDRPCGNRCFKYTGIVSHSQLASQRLSDAPREFPTLASSTTSLIRPRTTFSSLYSFSERSTPQKRCPVKECSPPRSSYRH
jgi:hypothetical protein